MTEYLDASFAIDSPELVSAYDELPLWSAPFGMLLLQHLPWYHGMKVLDVGCGTGFPLLELSQRLGRSCFVVGVDIWGAALRRVVEKQQAHGALNVAVVRASGARLPLADRSVDAVVSNLGINNFDDPAVVFTECARVAKPGAVLALTTNLRAHWSTFYEAFERVLRRLGHDDLLPELQAHADHRSTVAAIQALMERHGFAFRRVVEESLMMRFLDGSAFLRHYFVRLGFLGGWRAMIPADDAATVFRALEEELNRLAAGSGAMELAVPMAYLEGERC